MNLLLYHYGSAKNAKNMRDKLLYQKKRGLGEVLHDVDRDMWFSGEMPADFVIKPFKGDPPPQLKRHRLYGKKLIKVTQKKPVYKFRRLKK